MTIKLFFTPALYITLSLLAVAPLLAKDASPAKDDRDDQVSIVQISDTHLGDHHAPHAADNLKQAVKMINERHPDAVILSGDVGENPQAWDEAQSILKKLNAPLYYVPGNHDVHSKDVERYRNIFGKDYYEFQVKFVSFVIILTEDVSISLNVL